MESRCRRTLSLPQASACSNDFDYQISTEKLHCHGLQLQDFGNVLLDHLMLLMRPRGVSVGLLVFLIVFGGPTIGDILVGSSTRHCHGLVLRALSWLGFERLEGRRGQRDVDKYGGNIAAELEMRLGGMKEEVKNTINVFGR